ncbi:DUF1853 family protein [Chitinimonas sp.]|uniref:DUF1853 family protein n=1 Tax=Chitinimonas sp. TaxID=1934313 RepID=UPI002F924EBF
MPQQAIKDLHWLLTSPSLLRREALPAGIGHGDAALGQDWWQRLQGCVLEPPAAAAGPGFRLGRYAEGLMQTALAALPGHQLLAHQLPVREGGVSLGEFDYLLARPGGLPALHIELAVKFYIALPTVQGLHYVGPGLHDALALKLARLNEHQLRLAQTPAGQAALPEGVIVEPMAWLRGRMFYREPDTPAGRELAADHLRGWWRCWGEALPRQRPDSRWRSLAKPDWLASTADDGRALSYRDWQQETARHFVHSHWPLLVAEYAPPEEGGAELARGMLLAPNWPDPAMLARLCTQLPLAD